MKAVTRPLLGPRPVLVPPGLTALPPVGRRHELAPLEVFDAEILLQTPVVQGGEA